MAPQLTTTNGRLSARPGEMDRPGDQLLARPALAGEQDGPVDPGDRSISWKTEFIRALVPTMFAKRSAS